MATYLFIFLQPHNLMNIKQNPVFSPFPLHPKDSKVGQLEGRIKHCSMCIPREDLMLCSIYNSWLGNPPISLFLMFALNEPLHFEGNTD